MNQAAEQRSEVVDFADYLRGTVARFDDVMAELAARRQELAIRLDVIVAATSDRVADAVADYEARVAEERPYAGAEDAKAVLAEAHARYGT